MSESIGAKLRTLRKAKKMTQDELAALIGVKRATISNYEIDRRQPSLSDLKRFAEFFGVGLDYFGMESTFNSTNGFASMSCIYAILCK